MEVKYVNVQFNGSSQTVAVSSGITAEELENVLKTVFAVKGAIVGFQALVNSRMFAGA
jgi:hypothetical protein